MQLSAVTKFLIAGCLAIGLLVASTGISKGATPSVFAPGTISGPANDEAPAFTPDGKTVYFFRNNGVDYDILVSHRQGGHWSKPVIAPFSGKWRDLEPAMAPDGSYMIFASSRPVTTASKKALNGSWSGGTYPGKGGNLWRVNWTGSHWSKPIRLPNTVNRSNAVFSPSIAADGTLYFMEAAGIGNHFHLFYSHPKDGVYQKPKPLPFTAGKYGGVDPAVAPDQSFLVFSSARPPAPPQKQYIFIVFRKDGEWGIPIPLPKIVNRLGNPVELRLGSDGHTLYFSSNHVVPTAYPKDTSSAEESLKNMQIWNNGSENIWRIDLAPYLSVLSKQKSKGESQ